ncbi:hypothetical protein Q5752_005761 [Cryptotrichosporon argae]
MLAIADHNQLSTPNTSVQGPVTPTSAASHDDAYFHPAPSRGKAKHKAKLSKWRTAVPAEGGVCHLLALPADVLHVLLSRLAPRDLQRLASTCRALREGIDDDLLWRDCYVNRFLYDGAADDARAKEDVRVLVQGCLNTGGRGWRKEALSREAMIDRWTASKASMVVTDPQHNLIHSLSLSYPPFAPAAPKLVVGKHHATPLKHAGSTPPSPAPPSPSLGTGSSAALADTPSTPRLAHRQKYEAMIAASTRPPPFVLSACLGSGAVVKSDPLGGKVSKGYWGPDQDANNHLRPHWMRSSLPSALFLPRRTQSYILWGMPTGSVVYTSAQSRANTTHGGRATSVNTESAEADMHEGAVNDVWQPEPDVLDSAVRWVSAGADGRIKYWSTDVATGKRTPTSPVQSIRCLFSSSAGGKPFGNRSEAVKLRQNAKPDEMVLARCNVEHDVVAGTTADGDLRLWFNASTAPDEVRIDAGASEESGDVKRLELDCSVDGASVLVHHAGHAAFSRFDAKRSPQGWVTEETTYTTPHSLSLTALHAHLVSAPGIGIERAATLTARVISPTDTPARPSTPTSFTTPGASASQYGRYVVGGNAAGDVFIWPWAARPGQTVLPIRTWLAFNGKITALDMACGLVAVGNCDGQVAIFDPLPTPPTPLRRFSPPNTLRAGDAQVAASDAPNAAWYNINRLVLDNDLFVAAAGARVFAWRAGTGKGRRGGKDGPVKSRQSAGRAERAQCRVDMRALHQDAAETETAMRAEAAALTPTRAERQQAAAMDDLGLEDGDDALQYALMLSRDEAERAPGGAGEDYGPTVFDHHGDARDDDDAYDTYDGDFYDAGGPGRGAFATSASSRRSSAWAASRRSSGVGPSVDTAGQGSADWETERERRETQDAIRAVEAFSRQQEAELAEALEMIRLAEARAGA